jgi:hypothetical protein
MTRQPLYPHVPKSRNAAPRVPGQSGDITLRFLPDSPELLTQTMNGTGLRARLESVFLQAISRAKGVKSW